MTDSRFHIDPSGTPRLIYDDCLVRPETEKSYWDIERVSTDGQDQGGIIFKCSWGYSLTKAR